MVRYDECSLGSARTASGGKHARDVVLIGDTAPRLILLSCIKAHPSETRLLLTLELTGPRFRTLAGYCAGPFLLPLQSRSTCMWPLRSWYTAGRRHLYRHAPPYRGAHHPFLHGIAILALPLTLAHAYWLPLC